MPSSVRELWQRVVDGARRDLRQQSGEEPGEELDELLASHWPGARQAVIERLAAEESNGSDALYQQALERLEWDIPRQYPYCLCDTAAGHTH